MITSPEIESRDLYVRVRHTRLVDFIVDDPESPDHGKRIYSAKGGWTKVEIVKVDDDEMEVVATGEARCSLLDNYNKKRGAMIAFGRAVKTLEREGII